MLCQKNTRLRRFRTGGQGHAPILFFIVFASLICHAAGCLACGLTGSLAFAAAAGHSALCEVTRLNRFDVFHGNSLLSRMDNCVLHTQSLYLPFALPSMPGREIFAGKSKRSGRLGLLGKFGRPWEHVFLGEIRAETSCLRRRRKKDLTGNCVTRIIRLRELYYTYSTVCDEVLQYLFM